MRMISLAGARSQGESRPSRDEVEAAAKAYAEWQFPKMAWDDLREGMKNKFREGARKALEAAMRVRGE